VKNEIETTATMIAETMTTKRKKKFLVDSEGVVIEAKTRRYGI